MDSRREFSTVAQPPSLPFQSTSGVLETFVVSRLRHRQATGVQEAAELLGVHRSTLARSLHEEGTSWRYLLDRSRFVLAREYLTDTGAELKDIAHALGYTETSSFIRAFQRLAGMSPGKFRQKQKESS